MPIRINLLAEDQSLEELRRKDPVKRSIWIGGFVVFLVALWGLTVFLKMTSVRAEHSSLKSKWESIQKQVETVDGWRRQEVQIRQKLSALHQFTTNRLLYGNVLDALQQTVAENVQLTRFKAQQTFALVESAQPPGARAASGAPASARTSNAVERVILTLDGRDSSPRSGDGVPRYKEALARAPLFQASLQKTNNIQLTSLSAPQTDAVKGGSFVLFGLQMNFQEKERNLHE
jgi:Tfp pilus assembly protein PilN